MDIVIFDTEIKHGIATENNPLRSGAAWQQLTTRAD